MPITGPTTRRDFLQIAAAAGGSLALSASALARTERAVPKAERPMRLLILGGTGFIGPHMVRYAVARGHEVTIFNRGRRAEMFPDVDQVVGDRDNNVGEGLKGLEGREWDAVIDNSGYVTRHVRDSAQLLKDAAGAYVFISTISVYADASKKPIVESDTTATIDDPEVEVVDGRTYGALKAYCEQAVREAFGARACIVRPGYIVGPGDRTDRFTYWPVRIAKGGEVLAPGNPDDPIQWIDARDLSEWSVRLCEDRAAGVFNAVGPEADCSTAMMLHGIWGATNADCTFTWVDAAFMEEHGFGVPIYVSPASPYAGYGCVSRAAALGAGLTYRPLAETTRDLLAWWKSLPEGQTQRLHDRIAGDAERETLAAWKAR